MRFFMLLIVPKNLSSYLIGRISKIKAPRFLVRMLLKSFVFHFKINMKEAEKDLSSYESLEDLFTRRLKSGLRMTEGHFCSAADGLLIHSSSVSHGEVIQAKGITYSVNEFIFGEKKMGVFSPAWVSTIYLSPKNYHRVHAPFSGHIESFRYIPGTLWPVNNYFSNRVIGLYTQNERIVFKFRFSFGGIGYVVMVGAFGVGRMVTPIIPEFFSNNYGLRASPTMKEWIFPEEKIISVGQELGTFMLGSTVVIAIDQETKERFRPKEVHEKKEILLGESLTK